MVILHYFDYFIVCLEFRKYKFSSFFKIGWMFLVLCFSIWVWEACYQFLFVKKKTSLGEFWLRLDWDSNLQRIYVLTVLTHPTLEYGIAFLLFITEMTKTHCRNYDDEYRLCHFSQRYIIVLCVGVLQIFRYLALLSTELGPPKLSVLKL